MGTPKDTGSQLRDDVAGMSVPCCKGWFNGSGVECDDVCGCLWCHEQRHYQPIPECGRCLAVTA